MFRTTLAVEILFATLINLRSYSSCAQAYVRTLNGKGKIIGSLRLIVLALLA